MQKSFFYILFLSFLIAINAHSETYSFTRVDNTNGLSNNQIECIFRDSRGFMWFGTNFGLNRFDGIQVKIYKADRNDSTMLTYNSISEIQEDVNGDLWIRGNENYLIYDIRSEKFKRNLSSVLEKLNIHFNPTLVEIDKKKNYYFYHPQKGVFKYDTSSKKLTKFTQDNSGKNLSRGTIIKIRVVDNAFWVLHQSGLIERMNEKANTVDFRNNFKQKMPDGSALEKSLYIDNEGCPWVFPGVNDKGVLFYDFSKASWVYFGANIKGFKTPYVKAITNDFVRDVAQDQTGKIWIATDHGGINIWDKKTDQIKAVMNDPDNPNSISQNSVICLFADITGIMWLGTYKNGVSYYHPGMFKFEKSPLFFYQHPQLENKDCNSLYEDSKGNLWIGTNGSGLLKYSNIDNHFKIYRHNENNPNSISSDIIISSIEDNEGKMWFGTFLGGLNQMNGESFKTYFPQLNEQNSLSNKSVYGLVEDNKNNLWIGTLGGGLDKLDATRKIFSHHNMRNTKNLSSDYVLSLFSKDKTKIYFSTSLGIYVMNTKTGVIEPVFASQKLKNKLSDLVINYAMVDSKNQLWLATDNGINIYNKEKNTIHYINKTSGLPSDQVVSLIEDDNGNIWAGTRNGLACIYPYLNEDNKEYEYTIASFDESDGLVGSIFNQNAVFKNQNGLIYFGCTKGYTVFNPQNIHLNTIAPKPRLTGLKIGVDEILPGNKFKDRVILETSITHSNKLILNYNEKNFTLYFSALSYIHPEKNHYRYILKGLNDKWVETRWGAASYSNLEQGSYELIVYACNNDNVWSSEPLVIQIIVKPPFWLSWWAIAFYIAIVLYLIWIYVQYNLRKQKREFENEQSIREARQLHEMDEMKFRFFTNISHEFRTPLTLILNPVEKLLEETQSDEQKNLLNIVKRNANGLLDLVNQLLDFRKLDVQKDSLYLSVGDVVAFVKEICYSFTEMANKKTINFTFSSSVTELRMEFDPEKLRKIVYNLLSNAFKFTSESGKIDVQLSLIHLINDDKKLFQIVVSDTGIGIPDKDKNRIFERFYRVENGENGHQTGTGVGLHIVSEYVKLHNGQIKVESALGKGTTFTVFIPAKQQMNEEIITNGEAENEVPIVNEAKDKNEERSGKLPLMLIVDDNDDFRNFIAVLFANTFRIITAEDGEKALEITLEKMPDLIISDVIMPRMDGYELCKVLKQDIRTSHIPIILLTAKTGDENKYRGLEAGADDYVSKPFKMELLELKVSRIINRQQQQHDHFRKKIDINPSEIEITSMDEKFVRKAVALVETNIANTDFLVEDLCREMGMSRVYFYKKILSLTDKTPSEFIRFIRLKRASDLLEKSQLFVNEVAYQVGFNDPKYFRKYFKEEFGMSPNEYKKKFVK